MGFFQRPCRLPVGPAAHAVVAGAVGAAHDDGDLGDVGARHRRHHLGPVLGNPSRFILPAHHEAWGGGDVEEGEEEEEGFVNPRKTAGLFFRTSC